MSQMNSVQNKISDIVVNIIPHVESYKLSQDTDIFSLGLDSINAVRLIMNLQSEFGIEFSTSEINLDNFRTIQEMSILIDRKIAHQN